MAITIYIIYIILRIAYRQISLPQGPRQETFWAPADFEGTENQ